MKKGFTLIDILITTAIVGFVGAGTVFIVANSQRVANEYTKQAMIMSSISYLQQRISADIRGGCILESDSTNLIVKYADGAEVKWTFPEGKVKRNGSELNIPIPYDDYKVEPTIAADLAGKYYSAQISIDMSVCDGSETMRKNITNTYYCRIDPESYLVP